MEEDARIVLFPIQSDSAPAHEDPVADALARVGDIPLAEAEPAALQRRPNWPAIITFLALSILSLMAALVSTGPDDVIRWGAAMALVISILTGGLAVLYRHAPAFWRPGIEQSDGTGATGAGVMGPAPAAPTPP